MRIGLISDTHGTVHRDVHCLFDGVEAILHGGDVGDGVLEELGAIAPVYAVQGNTDYSSPELPLQRVVDLPLGKVALAHGHRQPDEKEARVRALLKTFEPNGVRIILHGHSHQQYLEYRQRVWVVNPGAAGRPRFGVMASVCVLEWQRDRDLLRFDFQPLDWS